MAVDPTTPGNEGPTGKVSDVISTFRPTRQFKPPNPKTSVHVTSLDFDDSGELAIVTQDDDSLQIYNCKEGKHAKELKSQKHGAHLARFTHHSQSVLHASTKGDNPNFIRYLSTHDNSYIRYFRGHTDAVTCLAVSPSDDTFLSCSRDNTVRVWNLKSSTAQGQLNLQAPYLCAFDPSATVIAIASPPTSTILLYDIRNYDKPPFASFDLLAHEQRYTPQSPGRLWTRLEFANDGKSLLVATQAGGHFVLDAFEGALRAFCVSEGGGAANRATPGESSSRVASQGDACLSPDGRYVLSGCGRNAVLVWDTHVEPQPGEQEAVLKPMSELPVPGGGRAAIVGYNPRHNLLMTADRDTVMWLPDPELAL